VLILVRHGQTDANARRLILGHADPSLTDVGRAQAAALVAAIGTPSRVVSSPLARARETAAAFGAPVDVDPRWIELDYGELDGVPVESVGDDLWLKWQDDLDFVPAGGESLASLGARVRAASEDLMAEAVDADVVVVTHVSPIKAALAWALGVGDGVAWRLFVGEAALTRIAIRPLGPVVMSFNEVYPPAAPPAP
jgi:broad specificity phosphatase PhoE